MSVAIPETNKVASPNRLVEVWGKRFSVPAGYVLVEWIGDKSPMQDPYIYFLMGTRHFTRDQKEVLREMARQAILRIPYSTSRTIKKSNAPGELKHLSKLSITWGPDPKALPQEPNSYLQLLTIKDAYLIQDQPCGHEFILHGDPDAKPVDPVDKLILPNVKFRLVGENEYKDFGSFRREMGPGWLPR